MSHCDNVMACKIVSNLSQKQEAKQLDGDVEGIDSWVFHCLVQKYVPCDNVMACNMVSNLTPFSTYSSPLSVKRVEPCYNDIGLCDNFSIALDILRYKLIPHHSP
jgi:hypothetical protein